MAIPYGGGYYQPPKQPKIPASPLAQAASGGTSATDPFGLRTARNTTGYGQPAAPITKTATLAPVKPVLPNPVGPPNTQPQQPGLPPTAPTPGGYDINTDPALQQVTALTGMSDDQANAAALKQRQQQVLAYGDPTLAAAVLGAGDPTVQAAGQNPNGTVEQIGTQYNRNLHDLDEQLNQANLFYGGYRVNQEQQAAQDEQNQLANAAAGVNGNLDQISGNLASTLAGNQAQRLAAANDAANRLAALAAAAGAATPTTGGGGGGGAGTGAQGPGLVITPNGDIAPTDASGNLIVPNNPHDLPLPGVTEDQNSQPLYSGSFTLPSTLAAAAAPKKKPVNYGGRALL